MAERLQALNASPSPSIEFWGNEDPKCPHCGAVCDVSENELWRLYEEGEHQVECPACEAEYTVTTNVKYSFSTDEQPEESAS